MARRTPTHSCAQLETAVRRQSLDLVDGLQVSLEPRPDIVFVLAAGISSREGLVLFPGAEEHSAEERRVSDCADTVRRAPGEHIARGGRAQDAVRALIRMERDACRAPLFHLRDGKIRDADRPDLAVVQKCRACAGRFGDRLRRRPVELIQIDAVHAEPLEARVALFQHVRAGRRSVGTQAVVAYSELREDHRPAGCRQRFHRRAHDTLGMPGPVNRRRVDPVDTMVHGRVNGRDAVGIILTAPLKSADRPRAETD